MWFRVKAKYIIKTLYKSLDSKRSIYKEHSYIDCEEVEYFVKVDGDKVAY